MYEESVLGNGLRLVTVEIPHAYSAAFGVWVGVGSRYESDGLAGASHFIEHMLFKGTQKRPTAREIALSIEGIGGIFNASTGQETTTYWAKVARHHLPAAVDTIFDMLLNSKFDPDEVEKERQIIVEEINEVLDLPEELVWLQLQELLWPEHPLGQDVAGSRESVARLSRSALLDYMHEHYSAPRMVVAIASCVSHQSARELIAPYVEGLPTHSTADYLPVKPLSGPRAAATFRDTEQAHFCLGVRGLDRLHPDRYVLHLLNTILGDGMSSRLFIEIRERLGLAYTVYSSIGFLQDTGSFAVYAGVDPEKLTSAIRAVLAELERVRRETVTDEELRAAKEYVKGRLLLRLEDTAANASWVGSQALLGKEIITPDEVIRCVDEVTASDVRRVAEDLIQENRMVLSVVGPVDTEADWEQLLRLA